MRLLLARSLYHWASEVREPWTVDAGAHAVADASIMSSAAVAMIDPATTIAETSGLTRKPRPIGSDRGEPRIAISFAGTTSTPLYRWC